MAVKRYLVFVWCCVFVFMFYFCTSDNSINPPDQTKKDYYPGTQGTNYKYQVEWFNSTGIIESGTRFIIYGDEMFINSVKYRIQQDSIDVNSNVTSNNSYFRKTSTGVFYYFDTTQVLGVTPDSLKNLISIQDEMRALLNPITVGSYWPVFRLTISLQTGASYKPIDINGYFVRQENLTLNLDSDTIDISADKVKYDFDLRTGLNQIPQRFSAVAWFADKIGMVKMEGSSVLISFLLYGEINFDDTTTTVTQNLISYEIK